MLLRTEVRDPYACDGLFLAVYADRVRELYTSPPRRDHRYTDCRSTRVLCVLAEADQAAHSSRCR